LHGGDEKMGVDVHKSPLLMLCAIALMGATPAPPPPDPASALAEFNTYCGGGVKLWGKSLCGPIILVDPQSRSAIATVDPKLPGFIREAGMWSGTLPPSTPIANTSIELDGQRLAEVMLPLPSDPIERRILLSHESFHRIQPALGFTGREADNGHLDSKDGRIFARLEIAALKQALNGRQWQPAARRALAYRAARLALFPGAKAAESALIANEGLAEYTGIRVGAGANATKYAVQRLDSATIRPSLIRSFGYVVGPAYGLLLDRVSNAWRSSALSGEALPDLLAAKLPGGAGLTAPDQTAAAIVAEETARDQTLQKRRSQLQASLIDGPTVTFPFEAMHIDFNPNTLFSLGDSGTVYSSATAIHDNWGTLKATGDVLLSPRWAFARVAGPAAVHGSQLSGPGWSAELAPGYTAEPGSRAGDLVIKKLNSP
jgi:hypothetical protein